MCSEFMVFGRGPQFVGGLGLILFAAVLMLWTEATLAAPITLLIVGIALVARSSRLRRSS